MDIQGRSIVGRENSLCKGPEGEWLVCSGSSKEGSWHRDMTWSDLKSSLWLLCGEETAGATVEAGSLMGWTWESISGSIFSRVSVVLFGCSLISECSWGLMAWFLTGARWFPSFLLFLPLLLTLCANIIKEWLFFCVCFLIFPALLRGNSHIIRHCSWYGTTGVRQAWSLPCCHCYSRGDIR